MVTPNFLAMPDMVSPDAMTYSAIGTVVGAAVGGEVEAGAVLAPGFAVLPVGLAVVEEEGFLAVEVEPVPSSSRRSLQPADAIDSPTTAATSQSPQ
jgi:hypothetical protein